MEFEDWEPIYEQILQDFQYDRGGDIRARDVLDNRIERFDLDSLDVEGKTVAIAGGADTLEDQLERVRSADAVFAASTAGDVLVDADISVDALITDLDKTPETAIELSHAGVPIAVHAHGDNISQIRRYIPDFDIDQILGTTQASPSYHVRNFGGFTDGDRAAFLADHLGAAELIFPGWDFDDESVSSEKARKLVWAERLLFYLQERRNQVFDVLEDRRVPIEPL